MISVPIRYRRAQRGLFIQKLQHAIPSIVVLGDGVSHLSHDPHGVELALGVAEVGVSVLVMGSVIRGFRDLRKRMARGGHDVHVPHGIDWIDILIGAMLSVEAYAKFHATAHIPRPTILLAVTMITIGLLHGRLAAWGERRRQLRISEDGITIPRKPFSRVFLPWPQVASIDVDDRWATITAADGRAHKFDLRDLMHPNAVRDAIVSAQTQLAESRHAAGASIESITTGK